MVHEIATPDGRTLEVHEAGDPDGVPVVAHHGTPGSGLPYAGDVALAGELGVRLIEYDRAGYGGSTPRRGRTVADVAEDVAAILDTLGVDRFVTWGGSGGGPHALACAARLPGRCLAATAVAGVAPYGAEGLDWLAGQGESNVQEWAAAQESREALTAFCEREADEMRGVTPEQLVESMRTLLSPPDQAVITDALGEHVVRAFTHALEPGVEGWVDDDLAFLHPWGFDLDEIAVPVQLWQGGQDLMVPPAHGRWLGAHVPGAELHLDDDEGHVSIRERRMAEILGRLVEHFQA